MNATASPSAPAFTRAGPGWRSRLESTPIQRLQGFGIAATLMAAAGLVQALNMAAAPGRVRDEGVLMSRAWLVQDAGSLSRLTDWYDHPPLGWLQLTAWTWATAAFERAPTAVAAGRELMLVAQVVSAGLLWVLARRLGLTRWAAAAGVALFGLSPLAVQLHRQVSLDNLAVPWVLGAFALASHPRRPLAAFAGSGACLAVAVLTNETALVFLPLLVWQLWRSSLPSTRRYGLVVGGSLFLLLCGGFVVHTLLAGELLSGEGQDGLLNGIWSRLVDPVSSGSVADPDSAIRHSLALWFDLDPVGLGLMLVAAPIALVAVPRLRPFGVAVVVIAAAVTLAPGFVSPSMLAGLLPFGALVVAGLANEIWGRRVVSPGSPAVPLVALATAAAMLVAVLVGPWVGAQRRLLRDDADAELLQAQSWIVDNVPRERRVIVDDAIWVDLVQAGSSPALLSGYALLDGTWRDHEVVLSTEALRDFPTLYPRAADALDRSVLLAVFGTGSDRIEIRRILPEGMLSAAAANHHDPLAAARAGEALSRNPSIGLGSEARQALVAGEVDERIMTTLVALAVDGPLQEVEFPVPAAEVDSGAPRRMVELRTGSADRAEETAELLRAQQAPYRPADITIGTDGLVTVTFTPAALIR